MGKGIESFIGKVYWSVKKLKENDCNRLGEEREREIERKSTLDPSFSISRMSSIQKKYTKAKFQCYTYNAFLFRMKAFFYIQYPSMDSANGIKAFHI